MWRANYRWLRVSTERCDSYVRDSVQLEERSTTTLWVWVKPLTYIVRTRIIAALSPFKSLSVCRHERTSAGRNSQVEVEQSMVNKHRLTYLLTQATRDATLVVVESQWLHCPDDCLDSIQMKQPRLCYFGRPLEDHCSIFQVCESKHGWPLFWYLA